MVPELVVVVEGSMVCPSCGSKSTDIRTSAKIDRSRESDGRFRVAYRCKACKHKFWVGARERNGN